MARRLLTWLLLGAVLLSAPGALPLAPAGAVSTPTYGLVTEPVDGMAPIYALINDAHRSVDMTMYELSDPEAEQDLAAAAQRGVKVRAVLDHNDVGTFNNVAFNYLQAHGVTVHWAPPTYDVTHEKTLVVDGTTAVIMTLNLTRQYYATSRDFAVVDRDRADVDAIEEVFNHDFAGITSSPEPTGADLVWSPGADARTVELIGDAHHRILVENEELSEYTIVDALAAAARRGVNVELVMTYQSSWADNLTKLAAAGAHVRTYPADAPIYIHAKVLDIDPGYADQQVDVGSQNFSWASLQYNRELGLVLGSRQGPLISSITATLQSDYAGATPWRA